MGLLADIQEDLAEAFDGDLSDVVEPFNFITSTEGVYDSEEDTRNPVEVLSPSRGIFSRFSNREIDGENILSTDEKVIVNGLDALVVPQINMEIELTGGKRYRIIDPGKVMGGESTPIVYNLQVRGNGN